MSHGMPEHDRSPAQAFAPLGTSPAPGGYTPQAGWYPDPHDPSRVRLWDGEMWTPESYPGPAAASAPSYQQPVVQSGFGGYAGTGSISGGYVPGYAPGQAAVAAGPARDAVHGPRRVGPIGAVSAAFTRVLDYGGRSSRSEYWWMVLILGGVYMALLVTGLSTSSTSHSTASDAALILLLPFYLLEFVITLPLLIRRLHDTGRSGWWSLLGFVPLGSLVVVAFTSEPSQAGRNAYGPGPA